jgi:hypothetical protein
MQEPKEVEFRRSAQFCIDEIRHQKNVETKLKTVGDAMSHIHAALSGVESMLRSCMYIDEHNEKRIREARRNIKLANSIVFARMPIEVMSMVVANEPGTVSVENKLRHRESEAKSDQR